MKNILVTGSKGNLASALIPELLSNFRVMGIDNNANLTFTNNPPQVARIPDRDWDIRQPMTFLYSQPIDYIVHLAAYKDARSDDVEAVYSNNVFGTKNVIELAMRTGAQLLFASTSAVYGYQQDVLDLESLSEEVETKPYSHYGHSKLICEQMIAEARGLSNTVIVRLPNLHPFLHKEPNLSYSSGDDVHSIFSRNRKEMRINGTGKQERGYLSYYECAVTLRRIIYNMHSLVPNPWTVNVGGTVKTVLEIANLFKTKETIFNWKPLREPGKVILDDRKLQSWLAAF